MSKILDPVALWQDLHQIPELAMQEVKTSAYVAKTLEELGIPVTRNVGGTGVVGYIRGEEPGPVLMLRADMDALPFTIDGKECAIHACGHDSHTAMEGRREARLPARRRKHHGCDRHDQGRCPRRRRLRLGRPHPSDSGRSRRPDLRGRDALGVAHDLR